MTSPRLIVSVGILVAATSCAVTPPEPGSTPPGTASVEDMRVELGRYSISIIPLGENLILGRPTHQGAVLLLPFPRGSAVTQVWKNGVLTSLQPSSGVFSGYAMNDSGDVAGRFDTIPAIWKAGASAPTPMLPGQEASAAKLSPWHINSRGEVILARDSPLSVGTKGVWKNGEFREMNECRIYGLNNQGVVLTGTCMGLYDTWYLTPSPFGATSVNSTRLAGSKCAYPSPHGRVSYGKAINDSNEVIDSDNAWTTAAGCLRLGRQIVGFNNRGVLIGYPSDFSCTPQLCDIAGVVVTARGAVPLDSLLTPAAAAEYAVVGVAGINDPGQITGFVRRRSDGARLAALFSPIR